MQTLFVNAFWLFSSNAFRTELLLIFSNVNQVSNQMKAVFNYEPGCYLRFMKFFNIQAYIFVTMSMLCFQFHQESKNSQGQAR